MLLRLILMRIRFRASDFGQVAKTNLVRANRNRLRVRNRMRDGARAICLLAPVISAVRFWDSVIPSQRRLLLSGAAPSALRSALDSSTPALTDYSLAAKRRAEALHVVFFSTKHPSPPRR